MTIAQNQGGLKDTLPFALNFMEIKKGTDFVKKEARLRYSHKKQVSIRRSKDLLDPTSMSSTSFSTSGGDSGGDESH